MGVGESEEEILIVYEPPGLVLTGRRAFHTEGAFVVLSPKSQPCSHSLRFCASVPLQDWQIVPLVRYRSPRAHPKAFVLELVLR